MIGVTIEGVIKPYIYAAVHQVEISSGRTPSLADALRHNLGQALDMLVNASSPSTYSVLGVRLSQWRNIAQHFSSSCQGQIVTLTYGSPGKRKSITVDREKLASALASIYHAYRAVKTAHSILLFDNLAELQSMGLSASSSIHTSIRSEAEIVRLTCAIASQGFEIVHFQHSESMLDVAVQDVSELDPDRRRLHASQFVVPLYFIKPATKVVLEYRDKSGRPYFRVTATEELIRRGQQTGDASIIAHEAEFIDLVNNVVIPPLNEKTDAR